MISPDDERWMRLAITVGTARGDDPAKTPIGAVIVRDGILLAAVANQTEQACDATAHAEIVAIRTAGAAIGEQDLRGATLYSTLEPCGMCACASIWAKIGRIVYGACRDDVHEMYFEGPAINAERLIADAYRDDVSIAGGCLRDECARLYFRPDDDVPVADQANL